MYEANYDDDGNPVEDQFTDFNNDSVINIDDRVRSGNPNPNWFLGLNLNASYKNWYMGTSMRAELGLMCTIIWHQTTETYKRVILPLIHPIFTVVF